MPEPEVDGAIVVAVDDSPENVAAVRWAAEEALLHDRPLVLVHAVTPDIVDTDEPVLRARFDRWRMHCARILLAKTKADLVEHTRLDADLISSAPYLDNPVKALTRLSDGAWMIVLGSRFRGSLGGRRIGSTSAALCYRARCPIAVIHTHEQIPAQRPVLVGVDGSAASTHAVALAFDEAARRRVGLVAVHAWSDENVLQLLGSDWEDYRGHAEAALRRAVADWRARYPDVEVIEKVYCDRPAHWLIEESEHAGLVVVGSHGRGAFSTQINGSVATAVAEGAAVPVIITRGT